MNKKKLIAALVAGSVLVGTVTNASANTTLVNRSAMLTRYAAATVSAPPANETAWIVAAARAVYAVGTRVASTRAVQGAIAYVAGEVIGRALGGQVSNKAAPSTEFASAFD